MIRGVLATAGALWRRRTFPYRFEDASDRRLGDSHAAYERRDVAELVAWKTERLLEGLQESEAVLDRQTAQNLLVLHRCSNGRPLDVLEIGGACGATYFRLSHLAPETIRSWRIVETSTMVDSAAARFSDHRLRFGTSVDVLEADGWEPSLVWAQGVLQFTASPLRLLSQLAASKAEWLYVTHTLTNGSTRTLHARYRGRLTDHGPGPAPAGLPTATTVAPVTIPPFESLLGSVEGRETVWIFKEGDDWPVDVVPAGIDWIGERGFLARQELP